MTARLLAATAVALAAGGMAQAQAQDGFSLSYGANLTSNYIFRGTTQSDDNPAVQGYVEGAYGLVYGGVWASTVDFDGSDQIEVNLIAGIRPSVGDLSLDLNYTRYIYDDTGNCCGEIILLAAYPASDVVEVAGGIYYDPELDTEWAEVGSSVSLGEVWAVGGVIGTDFGSLELGGADRVAWDLGVSRYVGDYFTVDLRYYESNYDPGTAVVSLAVDF